MGQACSIRLMEREPLWDELLSTSQKTLLAEVKGTVVITWWTAIGASLLLVNVLQRVEGKFRLSRCLVAGV